MDSRYDEIHNFTATKIFRETLSFTFFDVSGVLSPDEHKHYGSILTPFQASR
jgi:hypothetical protein